MICPFCDLLTIKITNQTAHAEGMICGKPDHYFYYAYNSPDDINFDVTIRNNYINIIGLDFYARPNAIFWEIKVNQKEGDCLIAEGCNPLTPIDAIHLIMKYKKLLAFL